MCALDPRQSDLDDFDLTGGKCGCKQDSEFVVDVSSSDSLHSRKPGKLRHERDQAILVLFGDLEVT